MFLKTFLIAFLGILEINALDYDVKEFINVVPQLTNSYIYDLEHRHDKSEKVIEEVRKLSVSVSNAGNILAAARKEVTNLLQKLDDDLHKDNINPEDKEFLKKEHSYFKGVKKSLYKWENKYARKKERLESIANSVPKITSLECVLPSLLSEVEDKKENYNRLRLAFNSSKINKNIELSKLVEEKIKKYENCKVTLIKHQNDLTFDEYAVSYTLKSLTAKENLKEEDKQALNRVKELSETIPHPSWIEGKPLVLYVIESRIEKWKKRKLKKEDSSSYCQIIRGGF